MATKIKAGDLIRVRRGGIARVKKYIRKYGVFLLDRPVTVRYPGDGDQSFDYFSTFHTFVPEDLTKIEGDDRG